MNTIITHFVFPAKLQFVSCACYFNEKDDKLVVIPYEASSMIGSLATIKQLFEKVK